MEALNFGETDMSLRARDEILAVLEEQVGASHCQLLRLAERRPVATLLTSILGTHSWQPTRREWLAMGEKQIFVADGDTSYHRLPTGLVCIAAAFAAAYTMYAGLHSSGWIDYPDFFSAAGCILGIIYIAAVPWNSEAALLEVWGEAISALLTTLLSPIGGFYEIVDGTDFSEYAGGLAVFLFTPAWGYGLFTLLSHEFGIAIAISAEVMFIAVVMGLFIVGQLKEARSRTPFREVFARVDIAAGRLEETVRGGE
jgi:hypothetical protein